MMTRRGDADDAKRAKVDAAAVGAGALIDAAFPHASGDDYVFDAGEH